MKQTGPHVGTIGIEKSGLTNLSHVHWNYDDETLYREALERGEAIAADGGPLAVTTGQHTGRSASDKFVLFDATTENTVWWDNNKPVSQEHFDTLRDDFLAHAQGRELFVQDLYGGADPAHRLSARIVTEFAWHALFIRYLLRVPGEADYAAFDPELTIINLPSFKADPERHGVRSETVIAIDFTNKLVLIGNTEYAGETKKSVFTTLNYLLPEKGVMPMHCSANVGADGHSAIFFGLSGTGKTTLSSDASRTLIGDDEHGWSEKRHL